MNKKQIKYPYSQLEKILAITGLLVIIIGCVANIYGVYNNLRFINDSTLTFLYYSRYVLLLGGGFALGYLITKKRENKLFAAVFYATLTLALSLLIDIVRIVLFTLGGISDLLGDMLFFGAPILSLVAAMIVATLSHIRKDRDILNRLTKTTLIAAFFIYELFMLATSVYFHVAKDALHDTSVPTLVLVGSLLTLPLVIALVSYLLLNKIKTRIDRLFYATFIATLYAALTIVLWELRTDASADATYIFNAAVSVVTLVFAGVLLWLTRKALK